MTKSVRTKQILKCPLCGTDGTILYEELADQLFGVKGRYSYRYCGNSICGLIWLTPRPIDADLGETYVNYYTHDEKDIKHISILQDLSRIPARFLDSIISRILGIKAKRKAMRYLGLEKRACGKLLEIGCGHGEKLSRFKSLGWNVIGQEIDPLAARYAEKHYEVPILLGPLHEHSLPSNRFDAIIMSHVLEHVPDPKQILDDCFRLLTDGGELIIITPNSESLAHKKFKQNWRGLEPPRHLHLFAKDNLEVFLKQSKFTSISIKTEAANSRSVYEASYLLQKGSNANKNIHPPTSIYYKSLFCQYKEWLMLMKKATVGQDIIAKAIK